MAACFNNSSSGPGDGGALPDVLAPDVNLPGAGKARYLVGGSVDYLWGSGLTLVGDNIEPLTIAPMNGAPSLKFFFKTAVPEGFPYKVTIDQQPTNPAQTCTISGASGKVGFGDVTGITVNFTSNRAVSGTGGSAGNGGTAAGGFGGGLLRRWGLRHGRSGRGPRPAGCNPAERRG